MFFTRRDFSLSAITLLAGCGGDTNFHQASSPNQLSSDNESVYLQITGSPIVGETLNAKAIGIPLNLESTVSWYTADGLKISEGNANLNIDQRFVGERIYSSIMYGEVKLTSALTERIALFSDDQRGVIYLIDEFGLLYRSVDFSRYSESKAEMLKSDVVGKGWNDWRLISGAFGGFFYATKYSDKKTYIFDTSELLFGIKQPEQLQKYLISGFSGEIKHLIFSFIQDISDIRVFLIDTLGNLYAGKHLRSPIDGQHSLLVQKIGEGYLNIDYCVLGDYGTFWMIAGAQIRFIDDSAKFLTRNYTQPVADLKNYNTLEVVDSSFVSPNTGMPYEIVIGPIDSKIYCHTKRGIEIWGLYNYKFWRYEKLIQNPHHSFQSGITAFPKLYYQFILAYVYKQSVPVNGKLQLCISSMSSTLNLEICKVAHNPAIVGPASTQSTEKWNLVKLHEQKIFNQINHEIPRNPGVDHCRWPVSFEFSLPVAWSSGMYVVKLSDPSGKQASFSVPFIVRPAKYTGNKILVLSNTNTWRAYGAWFGRQSFYMPIVSHNLSMLTPERNFHGMPGRGEHLADQESIFLAWLNKERYSFDLITDYDLHSNNAILENYDMLIIHTHPEYWSVEAYDKVKNYIQNGGKMLNLGGNSVYYAVKYSDSGLRMKTHRFDEGLIKRYNFNEINKPSEDLVGARFTENDHATYAPFRVIDADHPIFKNTGLRNGDLFGYDSQGGCASGHETDKMTALTQNLPNLKVLAKGTNQANPGYQSGSHLCGADMLYFKNSADGAVLSVNSLSFTQPLLYGFDSQHSLIIKNMISFLADE